MPPYIGNSPANTGNYQVVDDISASFDGTTTSFALTASSQAITPAKSGQLLVSINGVLQEPDDTGTDGFKVSSTNIVFSSAPASGSTFWCVYQGQNVDIGTPSDGTVGTAQMSYPLANFASTGIDDNATSTAITIDASESVAIGATNVAAGQVFGVNTTHAKSSTNEPVVINNQTNTAANAYGILIKYSGSSGNWSSGTGQNFIRCTDNGEGNQKFAVTGAGQVQAQTGIAFGGDTAAANTLDDYEEGTWTPTQTTSGTVNSIVSATYQKVGNTVFFNLDISCATSSSGNACIVSLPYTPIAFGTVQVFSCSTAYTTYGSVLHAEVQGGGGVKFRSSQSGGVLTEANLSAKRVTVAGSYIAA